jgi:ParB family transcriptional regulator, chromosome partitioning protein
MKNKSDNDPGNLKKFDKKEVQEINLDCIIPNRFQPRKSMDKESLKELIDSISVHGVLEPIIVRPAPKQPDIYEIIMGERRFRACQALQKETIPAVIKEADDRQMMEWALIENTHRKDLNPIERARAYYELATKFYLTHEKVAKRVGVDRATVTNFIRLLSLPAEIQADVGRQTIRVGHAMAILAVPDSTRRLRIWQRVKNEDLSVRHVRILVDAILRPRGIAVNSALRNRPVFKELNQNNDPAIREVALRLGQKFRVPVRIHVFKLSDKFMSASISINVHNEEEFQNIIKIMDK